MEHKVTVLLHTPREPDARLVEAALRRDDYEVNWVRSLDELDGGLADHDNVLICTQEGLTFRTLAYLEQLVQTQPPWANLPIIVILDQHIASAEVQSKLNGLFRRGGVTLLHRPLRALELATAVDAAVTARRKQIEIRDSIDYQVELQRELNHRVKNMMATFMAIYQMTMRQSESLTDFAERFEGRIRALSAVHDLLQGTRDGGRSLETICRNILAPYLQGEDRRLLVQGPEVLLTRTPAMSFGLILNELATNAVKYGALSWPGGTLSVSWDLSSSRAGRLEMQWTERGGTSVGLPQKTGFGTRFIDASVRGLGGAVSRDFRPTGLEFRLSVPGTSLNSER